MLVCFLFGVVSLSLSVELSKVCPSSVREFVINRVRYINTVDNHMI